MNIHESNCGKFFSYLKNPYHDIIIYIWFRNNTILDLRNPLKRLIYTKFYNGKLFSDLKTPI